MTTTNTIQITADVNNKRPTATDVPGAVDYDATVTVTRNGTSETWTGTLTFAPSQYDGRLETIGDARDYWISGDLLAKINALPEAAGDALVKLLADRGGEASVEVDARQAATPRAIRFLRTDRDSDASEVLTLVRITEGRLAGRNFTCADLDGAEYPYLVQVTTGPDSGDDFVGLYNLDGDRIDVGNCSWEVVTEAPAEVLTQIEQGWESGSSSVLPLVES